MLAGGREAECARAAWARRSPLFTGLPGSRGLLNGVDYWLTPRSQPVTSDCAVSAGPASRSVCLPPWDQGASAWPWPSPLPTGLCSGEGLHAHHALVLGSSVGSECRSSCLSPAPTKLTEAWRGQGLALGHTKVQAQRDMRPVVVLPHYCLMSLPSWDTSSLAARGLHQPQCLVHSLMAERRRQSPESQSLFSPHHPPHSLLSS